MSNTVTFDFDNTIVMSYMDIENPNLEYKFQGYNEEIIKIIKSHLHKGDDVHIVTSRHKSKEGHFPDDTVESHLEKLNLKDFFWPDKVHYTNGKLKKAMLNKLGSILHYDDDMEEHIANKGGISIKNPLEFYPDSKIVGKAVILDMNDRILMLQRGDEGHKWDLPGGHIKQIEADRGEQGVLDGLEREVAEETGLMLPFAEKIGDHSFTYKRKKSTVYVYMAKIVKSEPYIDLDIQETRENIASKWVSMDQIHHYLANATKVLLKSMEFIKNKGFLTEEQAWYLKKRRTDVKNRKKLIGMGGNKHTGGGKGHSRPKMTSPKSAPPNVGVLEEENEEKNSKIKVKITKKTDNLDEKRRKKRKKTPQKGRNRGSNWPYNGDFGGNSGDSGGDGGGGE